MPRPGLGCALWTRPVFSPKMNKTSFVVQYKFCTKKGFGSLLACSAPPPPAPPRGLWGLCARPGLCLALGASRVPPRSGRGAILAGGGGLASAGPWFSVVAPPARRPSRAPAPRRWAGSQALPSARFGLPCGRPPSAPGAAWPRTVARGPRWGPRRPSGRLPLLCGLCAPQNAV